MTFLLWSLLNSLLLGYFIYLVFGFISKGKKIFQNRFKLLSVTVVILGMVQVLSIHKADGAESRQVYLASYNGSEEVRMFRTKMQDHLSLDFVVMGKVVYEGEELVVMETESHISGFIFGYTWEHSSVHLMKADRSGIPRYHVSGILSWRLLGFTLYNQAKDFSGIIPSEDMY